ncbi:hypothetical protein [Streptomyces californicus]|uniref:hypothetical protein n=1 Tax=Streptomyces californicus TaxID=67351 RepID=UPI0004C24199|nr:hypothetical protein [Streptomyces californicus]QRV53468.1 hypothetical protein I6J40_04105 [Streptomyces californicus]
MSECTLSPDGDWVSAGTFDLRIVGSDPLGTFRVRPTSSTEPRRFRDCDGGTWTEFEPGWLRLTERVGGETMFVGTEDSMEDVRDTHGPLTEIRPDVDVRALLADVLEELGEELRGITDWKDTAPYLMGERLHTIFVGKARELREESA